MSDDEMRNVPYIVGRCTGEGDALLTGTIPIFLKAGLLEGFSREVFEMVLTGCFVSMAPHCLDEPEVWIQQILETYGESSAENQYFYSEVFCKWWGDLFLGIGPVVTADRYSKVNETFHFEMTHISKHSHDSDYSGNLKIKPSWSRCDHCDDTRMEYVIFHYLEYVLSLHVWSSIPWW